MRGGCIVVLRLGLGTNEVAAMFRSEEAAVRKAPHIFLMARQVGVLWTSGITEADYREARSWPRRGRRKTGWDMGGFGVP